MPAWRGVCANATPWRGGHTACNQITKEELQAAAVQRSKKAGEIACPEVADAEEAQLNTAFLTQVTTYSSALRKEYLLMTRRCGRPPQFQLGSIRRHTSGA